LSAAPLAARVVEVIADLGEAARPRYRYGSGCVVAGRTVLTAAHVVDGAVSVKVRDPDKVIHEATLDPGFVGEVNGPRPDLALVELTGPEIAMPAMGLAVVDRYSASADPVERCHAVGYPAFMERDAPDRGRVRETADAFGHVPVLSGLAGGLLTLQVSSAPRPLPPGGLRWESRSGVDHFPGHGTLSSGWVTVAAGGQGRRASHCLHATVSAASVLRGARNRARAGRFT
jgi:hypothetical protein